MSPTDNLCKQFGPRSGQAKIWPVWIQTVLYSGGISERMFEKVDFEKNQQTTKKHAHFSSMQRVKTNDNTPDSIHLENVERFLPCLVLT